MAGSTISGTIANTVTLGSASYPSPLTVTGTGAVLVSAYGSIGVYGPASSGTLINDGVIAGGVGMAGSGIGDTKGGTGGVGLSLRSASTATNDGLIVGGGGGYGGGSGGAGAYVGTGGALTNQATITGGFSGDPSEEEPGVSGAGVVLHGGILTNSGAIEGGYTNGYDGSGVVALAGTLINTGIISGGTGVSQSYGAGVAEFGSGVYLSSSATLLNDGTIVGSSRGDELSGSGGSGIYLAAGGTFTITGLVIGGASFYGAGAGVRLADGGSLDNVGTVVAGAGAGGVGVLLVDGGTLTNAATIIGGIPFFGLGGDGVFLQRGGVLMNTAFIIGGQGSGGQGSVRYIAGGVGVGLGSGAIATNSAGATITGGAGSSGGGAGVALVGGTLTNLGAVAGGNAYSSAAAASGSDGNGGIGVSLTDGGMVTNSASIGGGSGGHRYFGAEGGAGASIGGSTLGSTLINFGIITGGSGENVAPGASAMLTASGKFVGGAGVYIGAPETLKQHGTIVSWATDSLTNTATIVGGAGADVGAGGTFTNRGLVQGGDGVTEASKGTILNSGIIVSGIGAYVAAGGTLNNYGTVSGGIYNGVTADAVLFSAGGTLIVEPGARFVGQVVGSSTAADTLDLGSYYSEHGTLAGIGTQFVNFGQITIEAKASWTLTGANTIASGATLTELNGASLSATGTLLNNGAIVLDPSTMVVAALAGTGSSAIEAGSTLEVQSTIATGQTIAFGGTGAYLHLDAPDSVSGSITNFGDNETIDLKGINPSTVTYTSGHLTFSGGDIPLELANGGTVFASMGTDGAVITLLCFCANTRIMTPSGERPVQDLAIGDLVTTHRGEARPIVWIGNGKVLATRGRRSGATPVIVHKGALADNVPNRDLRVTKGHAFWFGGVLIPVEFLINHRLIEWDDRAQEVELYHIELETHDVLVANGAPAESYRDDGNRWLFRNANTGWGRPPLEPFAPVLTGGAVVDGVWRRLLDRAGPRRSVPLTDDPDLHLLADGQPLDVTERVGGAYVFRLPSVPSVLRVVSRAAAPAELGLARDSRVLGVALRRLVVRKGTHFRVTKANDGRLADGFHAFETDNDFRWTEGDAAIPAELFAGFTGPLELVLQIGATARYLADNRPQRAA